MSAVVPLRIFFSYFKQKTIAHVTFTKKMSSSKLSKKRSVKTASRRTRGGATSPSRGRRGRPVRNLPAKKRGSASRNRKPSNSRRVRRTGVRRSKTPRSRVLSPLTGGGVVGVQGGGNAEIAAGVGLAGLAAAGTAYYLQNKRATTAEAERVKVEAERVKAAAEKAAQEKAEGARVEALRQTTYQLAVTEISNNMKIQTERVQKIYNETTEIISRLTQIEQSNERDSTKKLRDALTKGNTDIKKQQNDIDTNILTLQNSVDQNLISQTGASIGKLTSALDAQVKKIKHAKNLLEGRSPKTAGKMIGAVVDQGVSAANYLSDPVRVISDAGAFVQTSVQSGLAGVKGSVKQGVGALNNYVNPISLAAPVSPASALNPSKLRRRNEEGIDIKSNNT